MAMRGDVEEDGSGGVGRRVMLTKCVLTTVLLVVLTAQPGFALTGIELERFCNAPRNTNEGTSCVAYIRGLTDGLYLADNMAGAADRWCPPNDAVPDVDQSVLIVQKYFQDHPEHLSRNAGTVATLALYLAFPCKQ